MRKAPGKRSVRHGGLRTFVGFFVASFAAAAAVLPLSMVATTTGPSGAYAADSFARTVSNGWGQADTGGAWTQVKGTASDLSVDGSSGVFSVPAAYYLSGEQILTLPSTSALNYTGSFVVSFGENINNYNPQHGGVVAYLVARYQNTSSTGYYRMGLVWEGSTRHLWLRTQDPAGIKQANDFTIQKDTGIDPTKDYASAPYAYNVKVQITGSKPTSFASKVWKVGTAEPSGWMLTGTDTKNLGPQVAGPIGFRGSNDLYTGSNNYVNYTAHIHIGSLSVAPVGAVVPAAAPPPKSAPAPVASPAPAAAAPAIPVPAAAPPPRPTVTVPAPAPAPAHAAVAPAPAPAHAAVPPSPPAPTPVITSAPSATTPAVTPNPLSALSASTPTHHGSGPSSSALSATTAGTSTSRHLIGLGGSFVLGTVIFMIAIMVWQRSGRGAHTRSRWIARRRWAT